MSASPAGPARRHCCVYFRVTISLTHMHTCSRHLFITTGMEHPCCHGNPVPSGVPSLAESFQRKHYFHLIFPFVLHMSLHDLLSHQQNAADICCHAALRNKNVECCVKNIRTKASRTRSYCENCEFSTLNLEIQYRTCLANIS